MSVVWSGSIYFDEQLYPGLSCLPACPFEDGQLVEVGEVETTGVDFSISSRAAISGRVVDAITQEPLSGVQVDGRYFVAWFNIWLTEHRTTTDENGNYQFDFLNPGRPLRLMARGAPGYRDMAWPSGPCCQGGEDISPILDSTVNTDFQMQTGPSISGQLIDTSTTHGLRGGVSIYDSYGELTQQASAGDDGVFQTIAMPPGTYYAKAQHSWYVTETLVRGLCQAYDFRNCYLGNQELEITDATPITVGETDGVSDIDFYFSPPVIFASGFR